MSCLAMLVHTTTIHQSVDILNKVAQELGVGAPTVLLMMRIVCGGVGQKVRSRLYRKAGSSVAFCIAVSVRATTNH